MPGRRVVITGMAAITALGKSLQSFWEDVCNGRSAISEITLFDSSKFKIHFAGEIKNFMAQPYLDPKEQKRLDRFAQFAVVAAAQAVDDAGIAFDKEDPFRCGVILGSGVGGLSEMVDAYERLINDPGKLSPMMIPRMMINSASGQVSIHYGLNGPISAVATACASASNAIGDAFKHIQRGDADVMITGGSEAAITHLGLGGFQAMRALSQYRGDPTEASRPFSADRDGFVLSEGAGVVVLEAYEHAIRRGARIYAELLGTGSTSDGTHMTAPDPEGKGAAGAMKQALFDAALPADAIGYINAHGTSTPLGDKAETFAIKRVFNDHARTVMISSTKSQLGHLLGASGGVELVITALALYKNTLPPTINLNKPDPECDLDYIPRNARELMVQYAMSNSFGFGGHNASLVLGRFHRRAETQRQAA